MYDGRYFACLRDTRAVDDLDGDGTSDLVVCQGAAFGHYPYIAGALVRLSGRTLEPFSGGAFIGDPAQGQPLYFDIVPDYDGDGVQDVIWGLGHAALPPTDTAATHAEVRSLRTGQSLGVFYNPANHAYWGWVIAGLGDVDGDGFGDVLVGSDQARIDIYGGPDGHLIRTHLLAVGAQTNAVGVGDVDQDGVPDYAISSAGPGDLWMFSGATGAELWRVDGLTFNWYGYALAAVGDVDGDGATDVAVGAPRSYQTVPGLPIVRGLVEVRSGRAGTFPRRIESAHPLATSFGYWVGAGGDVDGDGVPDLVIASRKEYNMTFEPRWFCEVHSLRTGTLLWRWVDPWLFYSLEATRPSILEDLDGDGDSEWCVTSWNAEPNGFASGRVWVFNGHFGDAATFCPGAPNSTGQACELAWLGPLGAGGWDHTVTIEHAPASTFAQLVVGVAQAPIPLGAGSLCVGGPTLERFGSPLAVDASGAAQYTFSSAPLATAPNPWTAGAALGLQAIYRDSAASGSTFATTNAWRLVLTP